MPSLKSRLFVFVLRHRHLLQKRSKRIEYVDENTSIDELRGIVEKGGDFFGKMPKGYSLEKININGMNAEWMKAPNAPSDKAILYFHGGGLVVGSVRAHRGIVFKFVKKSGINALVIDYALAPEHPYPAGLNDALSAYEYLLAQNFKPSDIIFMGDSGGGNICLASLVALKDKGMPFPAGAVALSPWTDLTNSGESWITNRKIDNLSWINSEKVFSKYYCGENDPKHPWISPLFGNLAGFPSLLIYAGGNETLLSDSTRFAAKAKEAGVDVTLHVGEGLFHCYPACAPLFPEAKDALDEISEFIKRHVG